MENKANRRYRRSMTEESGYLRDRRRSTTCSFVRNCHRHPPWVDLGTVFAADAVLDYRSAGGIRDHCPRSATGWLPSSLLHLDANHLRRESSRPRRGGSDRRNRALLVLQPQRGRGGRQRPGCSSSAAPTTIVSSAHRQAGGSPIGSRRHSGWENPMPGLPPTPTRFPTTPSWSDGHPHHRTTGGLTPFERLERGGNFGELDLPADHRANRSGPGEVEDAAPDVDTLPCREDSSSRKGRVVAGESTKAKATPNQVKVSVDCSAGWGAVASSSSMLEAKLPMISGVR